MSAVAAPYLVPANLPATRRRASTKLPYRAACFQRISVSAVPRVPPVVNDEYYRSVKQATDAEFFFNDSRPIMLFDGVCNLCNGGVRFVRANDPKRMIRYEALQSDSGRKLLIRSGRSPDDISSVVIVERDRSYIKSEAVLKIMEYLDLPFPQLALFLKIVPLFLRDFAYDNLADNRYNIFGRSDPESCEI